MPDAAFMARARSAAERLMRDTCTITRDPVFVADSALNATTGALTAGAATITIYDGACQAAPHQRQTERDEGEAPTVRRDYRVTIPIDAADVVIGDLVTVTASAHDPMLIGETYRVTGVPLRSFAFQRVLEVDHVVRADAQ